MYLWPLYNEVAARDTTDITNSPYQQPSNFSPNIEFLREQRPDPPSRLPHQRQSAKRCHREWCAASRYGKLASAEFCQRNTRWEDACLRGSHFLLSSPAHPRVGNAILAAMAVWFPSLSKPHIVFSVHCAPPPLTTVAFHAFVRVCFPFFSFHAVHGHAS